MKEPAVFYIIQNNIRTSADLKVLVIFRTRYYISRNTKEISTNQSSHCYYEDMTLALRLMSLNQSSHTLKFAILKFLLGEHTYFFVPGHVLVGIAKLSKMSMFWLVFPTDVLYSPHTLYLHCFDSSL